MMTMPMNVSTMLIVVCSRRSGIDHVGRWINDPIRSRDKVGSLISWMNYRRWYDYQRNHHHDDHFDHLKRARQYHHHHRHDDDSNDSVARHVGNDVDSPLFVGSDRTNIGSVTDPPSSKNEYWDRVPGMILLAKRNGHTRIPNGPTTMTQSYHYYYYYY